MTALTATLRTWAVKSLPVAYTIATTCIGAMLNARDLQTAGLTEQVQHAAARGPWALNRLAWRLVVGGLAGMAAGWLLRDQLNKVTKHLMQETSE